MTAPVTNRAAPPALRTAAVDRVAALRSRLGRIRADRVVRQQVSDLPAGTLPDGPVTILSHQHDLFVAAAGTGEARTILHLATDRRSRRLVAARRSIHEELARDTRLAPVRPLLPAPSQIDPDRSWMVQRASPGSAASQLDPAVRSDARVAALDVLGRLHTCTADTAILTEDQLDRWVNHPVALVAGAIGDAEAARGLAALHDRLTRELLDRPMTLARLHGDPSADNLLFDDDGAAVRALIDWESTFVGIPECDTVALICSWRRLEDRQELGDHVVSLLEDGWTEAEREALGPTWSVNDHVRPTTLVLLAWLHHVAANLEKAERYRHNRWWVHSNIHRVLRFVAGHEAVEVAADQKPTSPSSEGEPPAARWPAGPDTSVGSHRRQPVSLATLRWALVVTTLGGWLAWSAALPTALRLAPVLLSVVILPTMVLGRALAMDNALVRTVVAAGGIASVNVVLSELLLYAQRWSPGAHLVIVGLLAWVISLLVPRYTAAVPPTPAPPVVLGRGRARAGVEG